MKVYAKVTRGLQIGEIVTPHRHADGMYVLSSSRFKVDYIRVGTIGEFAEGLRKGLSGRMSSSTVRSPRLFSSSSITIKK
jgi:hypothetical protein